MPTSPGRWTLPTRATQAQAKAAQPARRRIPGGPGLPEVEVIDAVTDSATALAACDHCRSPQVPADMLVDLAPLSPAVREQLGVSEGARWLCTGCLGTAHNLGLISHAELLAAYNAPPAARALAEAHTLEFPYQHGSRAHADQHVLAARLPPRTPSTP